jgi:hypothetical protein
MLIAILEGVREDEESVTLMPIRIVGKSDFRFQMSVLSSQFSEQLRFFTSGSGFVLPETSFGIL